MIPAEEIASYISDTVKSSRGETISGAELATLVRFRFRDFSPPLYGCTNVREFIRKFVTGVVEVGLAGADIVYGLPQPTESQPQTPGLPVAPAHVPPLAAVARGHQLDPSIWKTFTSPSGPFKLYANPQTGEVHVVPPGEARPGPPWIHIPPCSAEFLLQIAKDFIEAHTDAAQKVELARTLNEPSWWNAYYALLQQYGVMTRWNQFRRDRILGEFNASLERLGISSSGFASRAAALAVTPRRQTPVRTWEPSQSPTRQDSSLRSLAVEVVRTMPTAELRALKISLGTIADALALR